VEATVALFGHFSIPETIYTDGGPQFLENGAFDQFCQEWNIRHISSSPYMPRSNGHAEAAVKVMKKMIAANISSNGILNKPATMKGLMVFRNTPRSPSNKSPAELIFGGPIRDGIPMRIQALLPQFRFYAEKQIQKHDITKLPDEIKKKELPLLAPKTPIRIQDPHTKKWSKTGFVVSFGANYREYIIRSGHRTYRRNIHFIKPINDENQSMPHQPVKPPPLKPATPLRSKFPVKDDW
jgi:hypothetical protein